MRCDKELLRQSSNDLPYPRSIIKLSESSLGISIAMIIIGRERKGKEINDATPSVSARFLHEHGREASKPLVSGSPAVLSSGRSAEPFSTGPESG